MRKALEALPWVRSAKVDFASRSVAVVVEKEKLKTDELIAALKGAGFGGALKK